MGTLKVTDREGATIIFSTDAIKMHLTDWPGKGWPTDKVLIVGKVDVNFV